MNDMFNYNIMKKILIMLCFVPLIMKAQKYEPLIRTSGNSLVKSGFNLIQSTNTLERGLLLKLIASNISEDSLTYNSSGDLVTYANADTVVLDGSADVVIGNSVRFGVPGAGTIYQVLDTLGSSDSLILDQTFTGSVTDEYYWGGVDTWYDESGEGNNLYQTTGIQQPKLLWAGVDSTQVDFDGVDDYIQSDPNLFNLNVFTYFININIFDDTGDIIRKRTGSTQGYLLFSSSSNLTRYIIDDEFNNAIDQSRPGKPNNVYSNVFYNMDLVNKEGYLLFDANRDDYDLSIITGSVENTGSLKIFGNSGFLKGRIKKISCYNRNLSENEINVLSQ